MNESMTTSEFRRARRRKVTGAVSVIDTMTDTVIGRLVNISETGMLIIANVPMVDDALYQLRFNLQEMMESAMSIEVGAHVLWIDHAGASGQTWTGFRFITMLESQMLELRRWLDTPGGAYE